MTGDVGMAVVGEQSRGMTIEDFNLAADDAAAELLRSCLDVAGWVADVAGGRPFPTQASLRVAGADASARLTWAQAQGALARHPRIGEHRAAVPGTGTDSAWSADEQAGVRNVDGGGLLQALAEGNRAYEQRFGHIFLICAAGLPADEILAQLNHRLANDQETEKSVVIGELRKIADLRLAKAVSG